MWNDLGMAGLSLARQLQHLAIHCALPLEIQVVEGRSRIGGRVYTVPIVSRREHAVLETAPGLGNRGVAGVDVGAQIITGFKRGNPMHVLLRKQLKLPAVYMKGEQSPIFMENGDRVVDRVDRGCEILYNTMLEAACRKRDIVEHCQRLDKTGFHMVSLADRFNHVYESHPSFPRLSTEHHSIVHWHVANLEFANATQLVNVDPLNWNMDDDFAFDGQHSMVRGGYGAAMRGLFLGHPPNCTTPQEFEARLNVTLAKEVGTIMCREQSVQLDFMEGKSIRADYAAITVSLGYVDGERP